MSQVAEGIDSALPASIQRLVELGVRAVDPEKVILYGSRARGAARNDSDYDLAFIFDSGRRLQWLRFLADLEDEPITLQPIDLLDWSEAGESLRKSIREEGVVLYERMSSR